MVDSKIEEILSLTEERKEIKNDLDKIDDFCSGRIFLSSPDSNSDDPEDFNYVYIPVQLQKEIVSLVEKQLKVRLDVINKTLKQM